MLNTKRNILLIEPPYKNKYPPIGLMKIATYHRLLGDNVTFYKGDVKAFIVEEIIADCIAKLGEIEPNIIWKNKTESIKKHITTNIKKHLNEILVDVEDMFSNLNSQRTLLELWLNHYKDYYKKKKYAQKENRKWDRVYVTTLFTFYWKVTIKAIEDAKLLVKDANEIKVGGVLASLLHKEVEETTGVKPFAGLLDKPGMLDDNDYIIDDLPLDYSILYEIDYNYPTGSAYFTFMTKGCTRKCAFCSVPILEPTYKEKIPTKDKFEEIKELYGEQQNLLLMDNNVLASPKFPEIIQEIKDMGFYKGATFIEPNQFEIAIKNLKQGINDKGYIRRSHELLSSFLDKRIKAKNQQIFYDILDKYKLLKLETTSKKNLIKAYKEIAPIYEKYRYKQPKKRHVDFNQGTDARYVTDELMKLMSEIPIYPLRIAFDYWGMKKQYEKAVRLAAKYEINHLSNYLLYNFKDKPEDLYNRIKLNVDISEELDIHIYSFPMKYIPLFGEEAKHRDFIGNKWSRKFLRAIQSISNVTRGIIPPGRSFFEKAYGKNIEEFFELLYMPETYLVYRKLFEVELELTQKWKAAFAALDENETKEAKEIIGINDFDDLISKTQNPKILNLLQHYTIKRGDVENSDNNYHLIKAKLDKLKTEFDTLVESDRFIELTLTYDHE